ncbi:MAG: hypothetical protein ACRD9R_16065, partial [Pyrinomonadaceae bacterium]
MRETWQLLASIFFIAAVIFAGVGLHTMYSYEANPSARIVGGDAYNFIIIAARGTGLICAGIVSALLGNAFLLLAIWSGKDLRIEPNAIG